MSSQRPSRLRRPEGIPSLAPALLVNGRPDPLPRMSWETARAGAFVLVFERLAWWIAKPEPLVLPGIHREACEPSLARPGSSRDRSLGRRVPKGSSERGTTLMTSPQRRQHHRSSSAGGEAVRDRRRQQRVRTHFQRDLKALGAKEFEGIRQPHRVAHIAAPVGLALSCGPMISCPVTVETKRITGGVAFRSPRAASSSRRAGST